MGGKKRSLKSCPTQQQQSQSYISNEQTIAYLHASLQHTHAYLLKFQSLSVFCMERYHHGLYHFKLIEPALSRTPNMKFKEVTATMQIENKLNNPTT